MTGEKEERSPRPQVGDIVDITLKGARVGHRSDPGWLNFFLGGTPHRLLTACPGITIRPATPADEVWPPQAGDVWQDRDGDLWFATDMNADDDPTGPCIEFVSTRGASHVDPEGARRAWGPIGLVYRWQGDR
ncbi:hypothetical protein ACFFV7_51090 [Nonomuraea spiralis]|uniref:Uncharacterized protein n=1 Tax=Nonomuraea spiralis TaxID=46182 RepID=A0ABV5IYJ3_9ACTN|nr:hypothetical protein [Nonomuraea spiralis]GGS88298.1 hypothetical protein GCM10010176_035080 [Nonomuraea spiralis]